MCGLVKTEMSLKRFAGSHKARPFDLGTTWLKLAMLKACIRIGKVREMDIAAETKDLLGCVRLSRWFVKVLLLVADIRLR